MNNLIFALTALIMLVSSLKDNKNSEKSSPILKTEFIEVSLNNENQSYLFKSINYNEINEKLEIITNNEISFIQIYNGSSQMQYQLKVGSKKVNISKNILNKGVNKLGFIIEVHESIEFLSVKVY